MCDICDDYGDHSELGYCPDCEVVGELEKLEEQNAELLKEIAELKGLLTVECIRGNDLAETIKFKDIEISKLHQRLMKE